MVLLGDIMIREYINRRYIHATTSKPIARRSVVGFVSGLIVTAGCTERSAAEAIQPRILISQGMRRFTDNDVEGSVHDFDRSVAF